MNSLAHQSGARLAEASAPSFLAWTEYGAADGRPVIFLHGWPSSRLMGQVWEETARRRGWRVLTPDRPGIGRSPSKPNWSFNEWPAVLERFLDERGISQCPVIGLSGGGPYALASAVHRPSRVSTVAVISGAPPLDDPADHALILKEFRILAAIERSAAPLMRWGFRCVAQVLRRADVPWMRRLLMTFGHFPDEAFLASQASTITLTAGLEAWRGGETGVLNEGRLYLQAWGFRPEDIALPVAFWHGSRDPFFHPSLAEKLARRVAGAVFHLVPGEGHFTPVYVVQEAVFDWLEQAAASS